MKEGILYLVGAGPGGIRDMTMRALDAIRSSSVLCGYTVYLDLIRSQLPESAGKRFLTTGMRQEKERCRMALEEAAGGECVAMICSGDAGIYGMAGPVLEMEKAYPCVGIEVIPGVTAAVSGAAILGAPLMNDFCVISLSDLLTPWETIEKRLRAAAQGDFVTVLYNPMSHRRTWQLPRACDIFLENTSSDTPCGWVRNIGRKDQEARHMTLRQLGQEKVDMFTTVFIGNSGMRQSGSYLIAPRGYERKAICEE